jgi:hypothetical protein
MNEDLKRAALFALNNDIIVPCDEDTLPLSVDEEDGLICWIGFESPELAKACSLIDPKQFKWGQINGLQYLKFLHERIEAGGDHVLVVNPSTERQVGMENSAITGFLEWLEANPEGLRQF